MDEISRLSTACTITRELLNEMEQKINNLVLEGASLHEAITQTFAIYLKAVRSYEIDLIDYDRLPKERI